MIVHGATHVFGSSTVILYSSVFGPTRVNRSMIFPSGDSGLPLSADSGLRPVVVTTSVSPSHRPTEVPIHDVIAGLTGARPSVGMTRVSWIISCDHASQPGPWTMRLPEL